MEMFQLRVHYLVQVTFKELKFPGRVANIGVAGSIDASQLWFNLCMFSLLVSSRFFGFFFIPEPVQWVHWMLQT